MTGIEWLDRIADGWLAFVAPRALEATVLALLILLVARQRRIPAVVRHGLLVVALLKFLLPPVTTPWSIELSLPHPSRLAAAAASRPDGGSDPALRNVATPTERDGLLLSSVAVPGVGNDSAPPNPAARDLPGRDPWVFGATTDDAERGPVLRTLATEPAGPPSARALATLASVQLLGALLLLLRHVVHRWRLRSLARRCRAADSALLRRSVQEASRRQGLRRPPTLVLSPDRLGPAAAGLFRRIIVLPDQVIEAMPAARLRPVIEHEVAHHRRGDLWIDLAVFAGSLAWWMNPVYWLLARALRATREECCDEVVAAVTPASTYCQSLLDVAAALGATRPALPALAHGTLAHPLGRRIRRMMDRTYRPRPKLSLSAVALLVAAAFVGLPAMTAPAAPAAPESEARPEAQTRPEAHATPETHATAEARPWAEAQATPEAQASAEAQAQATPTAQTRVSRRAQRNAEGSLPPETPFASSQSWIFADDRIELSDGAIDILVDRGIDRAFAEQMKRATNHDLTLAELRDMSQYGFDPRIADELEIWGVRELELGQLLRLVILDADVEYMESLRGVGYDDIGVEGVIRLARYDVEAVWIRDWQAGGYTELDVDGLVRLRRYEVQPSYAATYLEAGYELSVDNLIRLNRYEVDENAAQELAEAGLDEFTVDDLVRLQRYEVSVDYIRAVTEDGGVDVTVDSLIRLNRYSVSVEDIQGFRASGITPSVDDLVRLSRYEVDPRTAAELVDMGYTVDVDGLVTLSRYEVSPVLVRSLQESGYDGLSVSEIVTLKRYEIDADDVRALAAATERRFSTDDLVRLKRYEVSAAYIGALREIGFAEISVDDLIRLKRYEVSVEFIERLQRGGFDDLTIDRIIRLKRADG